MSDFYRTVKQRVENYLKEHNKNPKFSWEIIFRSLALVPLLIAFHFASVAYYPTFPLLGTLFAAFSGICSALICLVPVHEASHAALTNFPILWRLFGSIHDFGL
jgi:hypothetical protein